MGRRTAILALGAALLLAGSAPGAAQSPLPLASFHPMDPSAGETICTKAGGEVQQRQAMFGTNNDPSQWLDLGRSIELCRLQADDDDQSRIYVDLVTLASTVPTLASVAYLTKVPMSDSYDPDKGNPATQYCAELDGSSAFGDTAQGGGWVAPTDPIDVLLALCVFPDGSAIDEWGLAYHSGDVIRGADLATLFAYDASGGLPNMFES